MFYPNNGKVVIVDDRYDDVKYLIASLSSNNIPFTYFSDETGEDLPAKPIQNVRLLFLDLMLQTDITGMPPKSVVSTALGRLTRIIGNNNGPYFLLTWSTEYEKYIDILFEELEKETFPSTRPISVITLKKAELKDKGISVITEKIKETIEEFDSLKAFFYWESIINDSIGEVTNDFTSVVHNENNWNNLTKSLLYKLSHAFWGEMINKRSTNKSQGAFSTLNQIFSERINYNVIDSTSKVFEGLINKSSDNLDDLSAQINFKLNMSGYLLGDKISGEVFLPIDNSYREIQKLKNRKSLELTRHRENNQSGRTKRFNSIKELNQFFKGKITEQIEQMPAYDKCFRMILIESLTKNKDRPFKSIYAKSKFIELNITPKCDSAQQKLKKVRLLPGVLFPSEYVNYLKRYAEYNYISDFTFQFQGKNYVFLFDFRHLYSVLPEDIKQPAYFRLNDRLFNDLQVKLSSHINRIGLLYMS
nr:hypothetical protein [uncultured Draconibacterium sp.]